MKANKVWVVISSCFEDNLKDDRVPSHICFGERDAWRKAYLIVKEQIEYIKDDYVHGEDFNKMIDDVNQFAQQEKYSDVIEVYNKFVIEAELLDYVYIVNVFESEVE